MVTRSPRMLPSYSVTLGYRMQSRRGGSWVRYTHRDRSPSLRPPRSRERWSRTRRSSRPKQAWPRDRCSPACRCRQSAVGENRRRPPSPGGRRSRGPGSGSAPARSLGSRRPRSPQPHGSGPCAARTWRWPGSSPLPARPTPRPPGRESSCCLRHSIPRPPGGQAPLRSSQPCRSVQFNPSCVIAQCVPIGLARQDSPATPAAGRLGGAGCGRSGRPGRRRGSP